MMRRLWLFCALAVLLPTIGHAQSCAGDRPNDVCETAPAVGATTRSATEGTDASKLGNARDKVSGPIRAVLSSIEQQTLGAEARGFVARYSTDLVRINPAGEIQVYIELVEYLPEHIVQLEAHGVRVEVALPEFRLVQGWLPVGSVDVVAGLDFVKEVRQPDYPRTNAVGAAATQGDVLLRADAARATFGVSGVGAKVGVMSNGVQFIVDSQNSGDLPPVVQVLRAGSGNEGTAMLEIVHDLAPGAPLAFWGAATSVEMVQGINALRDAGARVIVDDLAVFGEPKFQDGMVAQTIRSFAESDGIYVASAGNWSMQHYRAPYLRDPITGSQYEGAHNYLPGGVDIGNTVIVPTGCSLTVWLQWNNPRGAANDDFDLLLIRSSNASLLASSLALQNGFQNAFEAVSWTNTTGATVAVYIAVLEWQLRTGTAIILDYFASHSCASDFLQYATASQSLAGNHAVNEMLSVAALGAENPAVAQAYSSRGPHDIFFPAFESRPVPKISAIDCAQTRTGQLGHFPNPFCGTSAAAPHVAGIAALLLQAAPGLSSQQARDILMGTAGDLGPTGFDLTYGSGRIDAFNALAVASPAVTKVISNATSFAAGQTVVLTLYASNPDGGQPVDLYVGALFPDGNTIASLVAPNVFGGLGQLSAPASVAPFATAAGGHAVSGLPVLNFTFPASGLPSGIYRAFAAYFGQGSLADNAIDNGDLIWLDIIDIAYTP
jgi:subtilisin family serine protease